MKENDYKEEYEEFWRYIVENDDGTLNKDQVMRELSDFSMVMDNCAKAYSTMTNGRISKQNTMFFEVENIFNDLFTYKSVYYEDMAEKDKEIGRLNNIIDELESYLEQQYLEWKDCETDVRFMAHEDKAILDKLKELKGSDKDGNMDKKSR